MTADQNQPGTKDNPLEPSNLVVRDNRGLSFGCPDCGSTYQLSPASANEPIYRCKLCGKYIGIKQQVPAWIPRSVTEAAVEHLDSALARAAGVDRSAVVHAIDPQRLRKFQDGGPPVWSVGMCPCANGDFLFVTYGLSHFIDSDAPFSHEMSVRVSKTPAGPPTWPTFLLRHLARHQLTSTRELHVGQLMSLGNAISRVALAPQFHQNIPHTAMQELAVVSDPLMQSVRRVYGLLPRESVLSTLWSTDRLVSEIALRDPLLTTRLERSCWRNDVVFEETAQRGMLAEGSSTEAMVVPGIRWEQTAQGFDVTFPGGQALRSMLDLVRMRLAYGRPLVVHDAEPGTFRQVAFLPGTEEWAKADDQTTLQFCLVVDGPKFQFLAGPACFEAPSIKIELTVK